MKMIILGAGASYDLHYNIHDLDDTNTLRYRPPLAKDLFHNRFKGIMQHFPGAYSLASEINSQIDIEFFFQTKWDLYLKTRSTIISNKIVNTQYYLARLLFEISLNYFGRGDSNLEVLISKAYDYCLNNDTEVLIVTFNYDILAEKAMQKILGLNISSMEYYIHTPIKLFKLHGSCNWVKSFKKKYTITNENKINKNSLTVYESNINLDNILENTNSDINIIQDIRNIDQHLPQILLPYKKKDTIILPESHKAELENKLPHIDEILIVGWKGSEFQFNELLKSKLSTKSIKITVVNGNEDRTIEDIMKPFIPRADFKYFNLDSSYRDTNTAKPQIHSGGSFSSYILNTSQDKYEDFFL